jgi:hypothetical protein
MGLMDKVKAQATVLAQKTQETAMQGKARLDQAQANRHADGLLRNLGALVYAEQTNRAAPDSEQKIAQLVAEISAHEAENGINLDAQPTGGFLPGLGAGAQGVPAQGTVPPPGSPVPSYPPPGAGAFPPAPGGPAGQPWTPEGTTGPQPGSAAFPPEAGPASAPPPAQPAAVPDPESPPADHDPSQFPPGTRPFPG